MSVLCLLSDGMCEKCRQPCHGAWWADEDQTSDPRDVFHHYHRRRLWVGAAASHTSSRGRWNQPPHQLFSVQCPGPHESVHVLTHRCLYIYRHDRESQSVHQGVRLCSCVCLLQAVTVWIQPVWARSGNVLAARPTPWLRLVSTP